MKSVHMSHLYFIGFYTSNIHLFYSSSWRNMLVLNTSRHVRCYCAHHTGTDLHLQLIRFTVCANVINYLCYSAQILDSTTSFPLHKTATYTSSNFMKYSVCRGLFEMKDTNTNLIKMLLVHMPELDYILPQPFRETRD